jgi:tetratricopeptide (TPR) repeat protein
MKKIPFSFALIILCVSLLFSQVYKGKGRILGFVYDEEGNPLEGVKVKLIYVKGNAGFDVETNAEGMWVASWIRNGTWNIDFEKLGFYPKQISIQVSEIKKNPEITVNLKKAEGLILTEELKNGLNEGNALFDEGKYEESIVIYAKLLEEYPEAYVLHKNIGNAYFQMEKFDLAEESYKKILEQDPENSEAMMFIGNCYTNRGDNEKALEWYNKIEFEEINDPNVLFNIGTRFYNLTKYPEALKYYKRSVEVKEDYIDGIYQLGLTHLALSNFQDALTVFESYLNYDPDSNRASQVRGFIEYLKRRIG